MYYIYSAQSGAISIFVGFISSNIVLVLRIDTRAVLCM